MQFTIPKLRVIGGFLTLSTAITLSIFRPQLISALDSFLPAPETAVVDSTHTTPLQRTFTNGMVELLPASPKLETKTSSSLTQLQTGGGGGDPTPTPDPSPTPGPDGCYTIRIQCPMAPCPPIKVCPSPKLDPYACWDPNNLPKSNTTAGSYQAGPSIHTLVEDITNDGYKDIMFTGLASGPLYAFDWQGNALPGWVGGKALTSGGAVYPVAYKAGDATTSGVVAGGVKDHIGRFNGLGTMLWEHPNGNYISSPPSILMNNPANGSAASIHLGQEDFRIYGLSILNGLAFGQWPVFSGGGQGIHTPALADIDNDGDVDVISASGMSTYLEVRAQEANGATKWTYEPVMSEADTFPVVGNLDGDSEKEIVLITSDPTSPQGNNIEVLDHNGLLVWSYDLTGTGSAYGTAPALADLDGNGIPEIVVQLEDTLHVVTPFVGEMAGWPVNLESSGTSMWMGNSAPVIGDLDSDQQPDIVITTQKVGSSIGEGFVHIFNKDGTYHAKASGPVAMQIGSGAVPAIADIDNDGHNEFIIRSNYWSGSSQVRDTLWCFDFSTPKDPASGPILWGQFMHDPQHTGSYTQP